MPGTFVVNKGEFQFNPVAISLFKDCLERFECFCQFARGVALGKPAGTVCIAGKWGTL